MYFGGGRILALPSMRRPRVIHEEGVLPQNPWALRHEEEFTGRICPFWVRCLLEARTDEILRGHGLSEGSLGDLPRISAVSGLPMEWGVFGGRLG